MTNQTRWWTVGIGVLMAVGSLLPWARSGIFTLAGTDGDGILTLVAGVIVAAVGLSNQATWITGTGVIVLGAGSLWIAWNTFSNLTEAGIDTGSVGGGLLVTLVASLFAVIAGAKIVGEAGKTAAQSESPPPASGD